MPPSPPQLPPTTRSATGSNLTSLGPPPPPKFKAPPPPPQVEVEEIVEVDSDPYVDPDPAPPPQVGEIMIARQVDGHPEVILRRAPKKARVGEVPNGEEVTVQWVEGEFVCVRWRHIEGVARVENLVRRSSESWPNNAGGHEAWCFRKQGWVKTTGAWYCPVCRFEAEGLGWISERTPEDIENIKTHCWCADRAHAPRICPACQGFNWAWRKACRHCGGATRQ